MTDTSLVERLEGMNASFNRGFETALLLGAIIFLLYLAATT